MFTMMKLFTYIALIFIASPSFGQEDKQSNEEVIFRRIGELSDEQLNNSGPSKLMFSGSNTDAVRLANQDIKNGTLFLLLQGGVAPTIIATDPTFEKEFDVYFYEYGCSGPEQRFIEAYNQVIFEHLAKKYKKSGIRKYETM